MAFSGRTWTRRIATEPPVSENVTPKTFGVCPASGKTGKLQLVRYGGHEVRGTGDGFLATFDGPARAIACAHAAVGAVGALGLDIRVGIHTGEVELVAGKVEGIAVHIGARVAAEAGRGEVLVSGIVRERSVALDRWNELVRLLEEHRAIDYAHRRAVEYADAAKSQLHVFPPSPQREALLALPDLLIARDR